jgi:hypothetical protein
MLCDHNIGGRSTRGGRFSRPDQGLQGVGIGSVTNGRDTGVYHQRALILPHSRHILTDTGVPQTIAAREILHFN